MVERKRNEMALPLHTGHEVPAPDRRRWWGLVAISLGVALIIVDSTIVNVAVPAIIGDLRIDAAQAQWVQESYAVVLAALLLVGGRLGDQFGRRQVFLAGTGVFVAASLLAAVAPDGPVLIAARLAQGVGGAMLLPTSLSLINTTFRGKERGQAFAVWGATIGGAAALGPLLGGWLTTELSWRWAFGVNLPLGALIVAGVLLFVARTPRSPGPVDLDPLGALLTALGFGGVTFGLIEGRSLGWWRATGELSVGGLSPAPLALAGGVLALLAFGALAVHRRRVGRSSLVDLDLFAIGSFRNGNLAAAVISLGEFGILFALPLWLQNVLGYTAFETGLLLVVLAAGSFAASGLGAVLTTRIGALQVVRIGIVLEIVGVGGLGLAISPSTGLGALVPLLLAYGVGVGLATAQVTNVVLADVPPERGGEASGVSSTARQVGSALGIAILGTVLFSRLAEESRAGLVALGLPPEAVAGTAGAITESAGSVIPVLAADPATVALADVARAALSSATSTAALVAAATLVLGLLATFRIRIAAPDPVAAEPAR
jgi:EmrB/QacA subfamily drug resistance transporter